MKSKESIYIAIIVTLIVHLVALLWTSEIKFESLNLALQSDYAKEIEMDLIEFDEEEEEIEEQIQQEKLISQIDQQVQNIIANMDSEQSSSNQSNYSSRRNESNEEVEARIRALEAKYFEDARSNSEIKDYVSQPSEFDSSVKDKKHEWWNNPKASNSPVSLSFKLKGRDLRDAPKPTYVCKNPGIVRVKIDVNKNGRVINSSIDPSHTNTQNSCLIEEALSYAKLAEFNSGSNQSGWIEYIFSGQ